MFRFSQRAAESKHQLAKSAGQLGRTEMLFSSLADKQPNECIRRLGQTVNVEPTRSNWPEQATLGPTCPDGRVAEPNVRPIGTDNTGNPFHCACFGWTHMGGCTLGLAVHESSPHRSNPRKPKRSGRPGACSVREVTQQWIEFYVVSQCHIPDMCVQPCGHRASCMTLPT